MEQADVVVVGGGPAGLSAALVLGRCRRTVLVFDHGRYRNAGARAVHGFLTRDGVPPAELRRLAHEELSRYPTVRLFSTQVVRARRLERGFELETADGRHVRCRKLVLATGVVDRVPPVQGLSALVGQSVFHCPYCDGWELRDAPLLAYGQGDSGARFALGLTVWSKDVELCTNEGELPSETLRAQLARHGVAVRTEPLERITGDENHVRIHFRDGTTLERRALFYAVGCEQTSDLCHQLGLPMAENGSPSVGRLEDSDVDGVYVAGDASRDALQAIVAAGEGSKAAVAINMALVREDLWEAAPSS